MTRRAQPRATKGSKFWLQRLISHYPELIEESLRRSLNLTKDESIIWLSPLEEDGFAEYQDESFLERIGVRLKYCPLAAFWPMGGPVWDALGRLSRGDVFLVEAKAHIGELNSTPCQAGPVALLRINRSLEDAARFFGSDSGSEWSKIHYQYANRLAHLYLLRQLNRIPAWLVFLYFLNAKEVGGPSSESEWRNAIANVHSKLGLDKKRLKPYIVNVFIDTSEIRHLAELQINDAQP